MCGIVGIVSRKNVVSDILEGLKKLEYRGYDSAGISLINADHINTVKKQGKIVNLETAILKNKKFSGNIGIGHTRWATHGKPSEENSHPHLSEDVAVVHNGIIENYQDLKEKLKKSGAKFVSQTDTEVIPHLISFHLKKSKDKRKAVLDAIAELHGAFALAIIFKGDEDFMAIAKKGSPLLVGFGENENYVASDYFALDALTSKISYLEDGDVGFLTTKKIEIFDANGKAVTREVKIIEKDLAKVSKENFAHFMQKEIFEQPRVIKDILDNYVSGENIILPNFPFDLKTIDKITIVACGTSYYAGMVGKYLIESLARINVEVDIASEFRYRGAAFAKNNLNIFISQSGETADTIAALKYAKEKGQKNLGIVNVAMSNMAYLSDAIIRTIAGPEIGVASTKAYIAQVTVLVLFAIEIAYLKKAIDEATKKKLIGELHNLPKKIEGIFKKETLNEIKSVAKTIKKYQSLIYIGRGISYPTALEGALKLKELSYINAFGIAAGELKHGTIALIDKKMPVIAIAPNSELFEKSASNIEEVVARGGKVILIGNKKGAEDLKKLIYKSVVLPEVENVIEEAILSVIATQLIAYYTANYKGHDVDQPRNLAKSVTVE